MRKRRPGHETSAPLPLAPRPVYRAARTLVAYWLGDRLALHNYRSQRLAAGSPLAVQILDFLRVWRTADEVGTAFSAHPRRFLEGVLRRLERFTLVERWVGPNPPPSEPTPPWGEWSPVADFFHFATKDQARAKGDALQEQERALEAQAAADPAPPALKAYPEAVTIALPTRTEAGEFASVLRSRRTWRGFSPEPLPAQDLGTLLDLTFGVRFWGDAGGGTRVMFKTSPSSGARHPLEAYVAALRVDGVPRGLYHYAPDSSRLERIRAGASPRELEGFLAGQWWYRTAAAVVFMAAVLPRSRWRYPFPRVYRSILLETGHFCQTFLLTATWLKLAPFCTAALADSRVERAFGLDGIDEVVLYAAGVGVRPRGMEGWVQWPGHEPGRPYVRPGRATRTRAKRA